LGPSHLPLNITDSSNPHTTPLNPITLPFDLSFIQFSCKFQGIAGCRVQGDGPVVISSIVDISARDAVMAGEVISEYGSNVHIEHLKSMCLIPNIGDVVVKIDGFAVSHLTSDQIETFINKRRRCSNDSSFITIEFRRYYVEQFEDYMVYCRKVIDFELNISASGNLNNKVVQDEIENQKIAYILERESITMRLNASCEVMQSVNHLLANVRLVMLQTDITHKLLQAKHSRSSCLPSTLPSSGTCVVHRYVFNSECYNKIDVLNVLDSNCTKCWDMVCRSFH
jgi:hypothetical protein